MTTKQIITAFVEEVLNQKKVELIDTYISADFINHSKNAIPGIDGVKKYFDLLNAAFPDRVVTITHALAENDLVTIYTEWTGTHKNTFLGFPATGNKVTVFTADLYRIRDGKLAEHWDVVNNTDMMILIGAITRKAN